MNDIEMKIVNSPDLVIFDIDETLIKPNAYTTIEGIKNGMYDNELLKSTIVNPNYQIAIASFNSDIGQEWIGGRRLGRAILDIQHPRNNSIESVSDDFIQAWVFKTYPEVFEYRKNMHINLILQAYQKKYGTNPPHIYFYDDQIENVYLASKKGVIAYWCNNGLTRLNIRNLIRLGTRIRFATFGILENWYNSLLINFGQLLRRQPIVTDKGHNIYDIYLALNKDYAKMWWAKFCTVLVQCNVQIIVMDSDLQ